MSNTRVRDALTIPHLLVLASILMTVCGAVNAEMIPPDWESDYRGTTFQLWDMGGPERANIGFDFDFYGQSFSQVGITANGYLGFGSTGPTNSDYTPEDWPSDNWGTEIASAMWTDFNPDGLTSVNTYYRTLGSAGNRRFIVTWEDTPDPDGGENTFQLQLHESGNRIQMSYLSLPVNPPDPAAHTTPVGVNYGDGVQHTSFNYNTAGNGDGPDGSLEGTTLWFDYNSETESYEYTSEQVPDPATLVLFLSGLGIGEAIRRRKS